MGTIKLNKKVAEVNAASAEANEKSAMNNSVIEIENQEVAEVKAENTGLCELAKQDGGFVEEIKELRTANETVYRRNDRTCRKIITAAPTRYRDKNGELKEISNRLIDNGAEIVNEANSFKVKFNKDGHSGKIFDLQRGDKKVALSAASTKRTRGHVCGCKCELCAGKDNSVTATLDDGTEIEYVTLNDRIKENIIVKERQESYEYNFTLNIGDMTVEEGENSELLLKDKETGETEFIIPAPYMYDSNRKRSDKVSYEIDVNGNELLIKVVADAEFINAETRAFPVTIDPQIVAFYGDLLTYYTEGYAEHNAENDIYPGEMFINAIKSGTASDSVCITVCKSKIDIDGTVEKVLLYIDAEADAQGYMLVLNKIYPLAEKEYVFDITEYYLAKDGDFDITLVGDTSKYGNENSKARFSNAMLLINYVSNGPVYSDEYTPVVKQIPLNRKADLYLNLKDGTANIGIDDEISDNMPFLNIKHIFKKSDDNFGCGKNMRLNLHRKLNVVKDDKTQTKYVYTDELGDKYLLKESFYFVNKSLEPVYVSKANVSVDFDGTLRCNDAPIFVKQTACGYTLISETSGFLNSDIIESRQNEQIQLEETVKSYERSLVNLMVVESAEGESRCEVVKRISGLGKADFTSFINKIESKNSLIAMQESNLPQFKQICLQYSDYKENYYEAYNEWAKDDSDANFKKYQDAKELYDLSKEQVESFVTQCRQNLEYIKDSFNNYLIKNRELTMLLKQTPVNYLRDENGIINGFNRYGDLVLIADSYGNYVNILYNEENRITQIYDNKDKVMQFKYANGLLQSITDSLGRQLKWTYDDDNQLKILTFPDGETLTFEYQSANMSSITTSSGMQTKLSTDEFNRIKTISENSFSIKIAYGTEPDGNSYTAFQNQENEIEKFDFTADGKVKKHETIDNCLVKTVKEYTYDESGKVTKTVTSNDVKQTEEETLTYDGLDRVIKTESGWQNVSDTVKTKTVKNYHYDLDGNLIKEVITVKTDVGSSVRDKVTTVNYSYNPQGSLTLTESYIEDEKLTTGINYEQRVYDDSGNLVKRIRWNSLDSTSKFYTESERAENGQVTADRDETGEVSAEYEYLSGTNVVNSVKYPNGSKLAYGRNPNNFKVTGITRSTADGEANVTDITYSNDLPIRLKSGNTEISYSYDTKGRKKTVYTTFWIISEYRYKDYKRETLSDVLYAENTKILYSASEKVEFVYVKRGLLDGEVNRMATFEQLTVGSETLYRKDYNSDGDLTKVTYKDLTEKAVQYEYDNLHNLIKAETSSDGAVVFTENYTYNRYGKIDVKTITGAANQEYKYFYNRNAALSLDYILFDFTYRLKPLTDVYGRNTGREIHNGANNILSEYITYRKVGDHATNMPATVWFGNGGKIADSIKYKYDSCGNICQITENGHVVAKYTYDSLNRLIREDNKQLNKTVLFSYDRCGNITERCEYAYTLKSGEELAELNCTHYSYDYDGDKLVNYNGETFAYDSYGTTGKYRGKICVWQYCTRLIRLDATTFAYDGLGRRISKNGITFTYDSDGRLIKQSNGLEFIYDNAGVAGVKYNNTTYFYRKDVQGNIIAILDSNGAVVVKYEYDAWGNHTVKDNNGRVITSGIGILNPFRYRGYYYDTETELYYLQTRYYDPEIGRFISQDSIEYADPETINGLNLYAYCGNNPVMAIDPNGCSWSSFWNGVGNWFKSAGNSIKNFFVDGVYGGVIKPATDWVVDVAASAVINFFTGTIPNFFVNTVYNGGLKPAWNAVANLFANTIPYFFVNTVWNGGLVPAWNSVSNFFTNTIPDFFVNTVWKKGLVVAWNWLWHSKAGQIVYSAVGLGISIAGLIISAVGCVTPASPLAIAGVVFSALGVLVSFGSLMSAIFS